ITEHFYNCGKFRYEVSPYYTNDEFYLREMIEWLTAGGGLRQNVNCSDCATAVSTFANVLGCDLAQCRLGRPAPGMSSTGAIFDLNPILAIGFAPPDPGPTCNCFFYHEVAWKSVSDGRGRVFDGCLMIDGDRDPAALPHKWRLPMGMRFG